MMSNMHTSRPAWRNVLDAHLDRHSHLPSSRFVQVATVRQDGRPANRTMTFRFFFEEDCLLFTADARTEKMAELSRSPWAELCWYFTETRTQVRLLGTMRPARPQDESTLRARSRTWAERSDESRQSFTWPPAGDPLAPPPAFSAPAPSVPPENFSVLLFSPERVEALDLGSQPHARELHSLSDGVWMATRINP